MKKLGVHRIFLHRAGIITPRAEDRLDFLCLFRSRIDGGRNAFRYSGFVLPCRGIYHLCNGLSLLRFALGLICRVDHRLFQCGIQHRIPHLRQKLRELLLRLIPRGLQLFEGFQCAILAAKFRQQLIQLRADLCCKFGRSLVSGQFPAFADRLDRGIVRILGHMVKQLCVEFLCLCRKPVRVGSLRKQRVKRLKNISGQCRKAVQLGRSLLLDGFHAFIVLTQIAVNAILQFRTLQNTIRFLCCGHSGILKIAPSGIQYALYSAKILLQRDTSCWEYTECFSS